MPDNLKILEELKSNFDTQTSLKCILKQLAGVLETYPSSQYRRCVSHNQGEPLTVVDRAIRVVSSWPNPIHIDFHFSES